MERVKLERGEFPVCDHLLCTYITYEYLVRILYHIFLHNYSKRRKSKITKISFSVTLTKFHNLDVGHNILEGL
jgi:hypothetical protein